jgi:hypothetical protein
LKQEKRKRPPTGGGAIYPQTGPSHACVESKEEVDGVLGALGGARDPRFLRSRKAPCQGKTARSPLRQPQATNTSREALIERVGICMTKQCRRAPRQTKEEVSNTTTHIAAAAAPAARLLLKRAGAGAPGILSRAGGLTFITSKEVQKWSVWRTAAFMPPPPATCQRPEIHATCQRPEIHATCQRPEIHATCQRPEIHATCQRPEIHATCQSPEIHATCQRPEFTLPAKGRRFTLPAKDRRFTLPAKDRRFTLHAKGRRPALQAS